MNIKSIKNIGYGLSLTLWAILPSTITGVIVTIKEIENPTIVYLLQGTIIGLALCLTLILLKIRGKSLRLFSLGNITASKWFLLIAIIELLPFIAGIHLNANPALWLSLLFLMVMVGCFEELIFRQLVLEKFIDSDMKHAVLGSALFFGLGHAANLMAGQDLLTTLLQILFALLFGIVTAKMVLHFQTITWGILWHTAHNFIDQLTARNQSQLHLLLLIAQIILLFVLIFMIPTTKNNQVEHQN